MRQVELLPRQSTACECLCLPLHTPHTSHLAAGQKRFWLFSGVPVLLLILRDQLELGTMLRERSVGSSNALDFSCFIGDDTHTHAVSAVSCVGAICVQSGAHTLQGWVTEL